MATTYQGPATLVAPGRKLEVVADLRVEWQWPEAVNGHGHVVRERGLKEWLGSLQSGDDSFWVVLESSPRLRLPDGREGSFFSHLGTPDTLTEGRVEIQGVGAAPFWDEADEPTS